jgi:prohibitin 1
MQRLLRATSVGGFTLAGLGILGLSTLYTVDGGERAIIYDLFQGIKEDNVKGEGMHFKIPYIQQPIIFDVRIKPKSIPTTTGTKDLQTVHITLTVLHRPRYDKLAFIFKEFGKNYDERVLPSIGNEIMKSVVAQYNAEELITRREQVSQEIRDRIRKKAYDQFYIDLVGVAITDLTFGKEFSSAVEAKQVAQQESERAKYIVQKSEQEKLASIIRAEGESEAAQLISSALSEAGSGLIELRKIEASKEVANTLAKSKNITYLPEHTNYLLTGAGPSTK